MARRFALFTTKLSENSSGTLRSTTAAEWFPLGSHVGSPSLMIVDVHGRPNQAGDLLKHAGRSGLNCGLQALKAREGSRPPWVQIPLLLAIYQLKRWSVCWQVTGVCAVGCICPANVDTSLATDFTNPSSSSTLGCDHGQSPFCLAGRQ
jgi:hypothetical protein